MRLVLLLLFAVPVFGQAQWVEKPIGHWSCNYMGAQGGKYYFDVQDLNDVPEGETPKCRLGVPLEHHGYDHIRFEEIVWKAKHPVPASGVVELDWPADFVKAPGCQIVGSITGFIEETKQRLVIKAKPGTVLSFTCGATIPRKKQ